MKKSANNGRRPQTATEKKKLMVGLDGHWLTFPFPFVHHQPLHIFYLSSSFLFHVYLQRKRKINIRRNKKEEGEDRRLPTVETRCCLLRVSTGLLSVPSLINYIFAHHFVLFPVFLSLLLYFRRRPGKGAEDGDDKRRG